MWLLTVILVVVLFLLLRLLLSPLPSSKNMPPGPVGLPVLGNLLDLLQENAAEYFTRLSGEYGPLISVQMGFKRVVVINSRKWLHQAFVKQGDVFNHRPKGNVMSFIMGGRGVVYSVGTKWQESRKLTLQVLKEFGMGKRSLENYVNLEVESLMDTFKKNVGKPYVIRNDIATSVFNIVWHMFVGERFEMGDPTLRWMVTSIDDTVSFIIQGGFLDFTPLLQFIGTFYRPKAFKIFFSLLRRMKHFYSLIRGHKAKLDDPERQHDLIFSFLEEQRTLEKQGKPLGTFTNMQLMWLLSDLFVAGLDTSVSALRWCILFLIRRPDVTAKLQAEIDTVVGNDRKPSLTDKSSMPYMEAYISEVLRYSSVLAVTSHATCEEAMLGGYHIPKDTTIIANVYGIHHDPNVWGDPENFRPERFLSPAGELIMTEHLAAFSLGRRNCLGESLARAEIFLFMSALIQEFKFLPDGEMPSSRYMYGLFLHPRPYKVILQPRHCGAGAGEELPERVTASDGDRKNREQEEVLENNNNSVHLLKKGTTNLDDSKPPLIMEDV